MNAPKDKTPKPRKTAVERAVEAVLALRVRDVPDFCVALQLADEWTAERVGRELHDRDFYVEPQE